MHLCYKVCNELISILPTKTGLDNCLKLNKVLNLVTRCAKQRKFFHKNVAILFCFCSFVYKLR